MVKTVKGLLLYLLIEHARWIWPKKKNDYTEKNPIFTVKYGAGAEKF